MIRVLVGILRTITTLILWLTLPSIFIIVGEVIVLVGRDDSALACWVAVGIATSTTISVAVWIGITVGIDIVVGVDKVLFGDACTILISIVFILRVLPHDV